MICVIFSKNRAMQLDAAIKSLYSRCTDIEKLNIVVLYTTSTLPHYVTKSGLKVKDKLVDRFDKQYLQLIEEYPDVKFIAENNFKEDLIRILMTCNQGCVMFVVDDTIFIKDFSIKDIVSGLVDNIDSLGFSLRLGANTTYSYMSNRNQILPTFNTNKNILNYSWVGQQGDFGYPLELSSSVYRISQLLIPLQVKDFNTPNTLESSMQSMNTFFQPSFPTLLCYKTSRAFSNPINIVQKKKTNRHGKNKLYTSETLAKKFDEGYRIDVSKYFNITPKAVHQEEELHFKEMV